MEQAPKKKGEEEDSRSDGLTDRLDTALTLDDVPLWGDGPI